MKTTHRNYSEENGDSIRLSRFFTQHGTAHSDFRQRGFPCIIQECLHRLKDIGIHNAYATGYGPRAVAVYGSLGAADEVRSSVYEVGA